MIETNTRLRRRAGFALALILMFTAANATAATTAAPAPTVAGVKRTLEGLLLGGTHIDQVDLYGTRAVVAGGSQTAAEVSQLLRNIDNAGVFESATLEIMERQGAGMRFSISFQAHCPKTGEHVANNPCAAAGDAPAVCKCRINGTLTFQSQPCAPGSEP
jgi:hypothetical protein